MQLAGEESQALDWLPNLRVGMAFTITGLKRGKAAPGTFASYKYHLISFQSCKVLLSDSWSTRTLYTVPTTNNLQSSEQDVGTPSKSVCMA